MLRPSCFLVAALSLSAATITTDWTGASSGDWTTAGNWDNGIAQNVGGTDYIASIGSVAAGGVTAVSLGTSLSVAGFTLNAPDRLTIASGQTLTLDSGTTNASGNIVGSLQLVGAATATFSGQVLGTVTNSSTGQVTFGSSAPGPSLVNPNGGIININGSLLGSTISNDGTINLTSGGASGIATLSGAGTLNLVNANLGGGGLITSSSNISGYGTVSTTHFNNDGGVVTASGGTLTFTGGFANSGNVYSSSGSALTLSVPTDNSGVFQANAGSTMTLHGDTTGSGQLIANGGTLELQQFNSSATTYASDVIAENSGHVDDTNSRLTGTTTVQSTASLSMLGGSSISNLIVQSGGSADFGPSTAVLAGSNSGSITVSGDLTLSTPFVNNADGTITVSSGNFLRMLGPGGTFTNNGAIQLNGGTMQNGVSNGPGVNTMDGTGTLTLAAASLSPNGVQQGMISAAGYTIQGNGSISVVLTNDGNIIGSGGNLTIDGGLFANNGVVNAQSGSVIVVPFGTNGFQNYASGVLTGGEYDVHNGETIQFAGADITTNDASIALFGSGKIVDSNNTATNGLRDFLTNDGTFDLEGATFTSSSADNFDNNGDVVVGAGSQFNLGAGEKFVNNTGATLSGTGTVNGPVANIGGIVSPGDDPGTLTIAGSYLQNSRGELDIEFASPTSFSELDVSGEADLAGTLRIIVDPGFDADLGDTFEIVTAGTLDGSFDTFVSDTYFDGKGFQLERISDGYELEVVTAPEPSTLLLGIAGCIAGFAVRRRKQRKYLAA